MDNKIYSKYLNALKKELVLALGCTEPIAVAYAAAKAREILGSMPKKLVVKCSGNIIKNVKDEDVEETKKLLNKGNCTGHLFSAPCWRFI